jgi:hypothetical protein
MPETLLQEIAHGVTWWIEAASKSINRHEKILLDMCHRVLALPLEAGSGITSNGKPMDKPVTEAINHPVGHITQAIINLWFKRKPNDGELLAADLKPLFSKLCDVEIDRFRHGRVLLGSQLIALFRVDQIWTEQYLLPLLSWSNPAEAKAVWEGFLWSPRIYQPLMIAFKLQFLESANHYAELGEHRQQFSAFLTYVALESTASYTSEEFRSAIGVLPQEGLEESAQALSQAIEGASEQREEYWKNRILPFWQHIWPKSRNLATPQIAEQLAQLVIAAGSEFPAALTAIRDWLRPVEYPDYIVTLLYEANLCQRFPDKALCLLNGILKNLQWVPIELEQCLKHIVQAKPILAKDAGYIQLNNYLLKMAS